MDDRIYFHQYRRPRHSNLTYVSSNVQNSMTFFNGGFPSEPRSTNIPQRSYTIDPVYSQNQASSAIAPPLRTQLPPRYENEPRQEQSKLSNYGVRSLQLDQRGVYHKQSSPYDIVSLKPKQYSSDIKQYPWFSIENRDDVYYRRMNDQYKEKSLYNSRTRTLEKPPSGGQPIAGKQTYDLEPKISLNPEGKGREYFTAKMLNHMDELQHNLA